MTDIDPWTLYSRTRDRMIALVRPLTADQAGQFVPMTPGWTITEVVAHVCGLNADVASGMREGMGSDERTKYQVDSRAGANLETLCDEWLWHADAMRAAIDEDGFFGFRLSADLVVHLHDVQHALGQPIDSGDEATVSGGRTYATRTPDRMAELAAVDLSIELSEGSRFEPSEGAGSGLPKLVLRTTPYDFLRSVTGRRSRAAVRALNWSRNQPGNQPGEAVLSGELSRVLDHLSPYGPLRETDANV